MKIDCVIGTLDVSGLIGVFGSEPDCDCPAVCSLPEFILPRAVTGKNGQPILRQAGDEISFGLYDLLDVLKACDVCRANSCNDSDLR